MSASSDESANPIVPSPIPGFPNVTASPDYASNVAESPWLRPRILPPKAATYPKPEPKKGGKRTKRKRPKRKRSRRRL
jgi:hypothetical protein